MTKLFRSTTLFLILIVGALSIPSHHANAQRWLQTSQLFVDLNQLETENTPKVLLDTLTQVLERRDSLRVQREPGGDKMLVSELRNALIDGPGIGLSSGASGIFIDYRFEIQNRGFEESIEGIQYVFRPPGGAGEDVPILYVDTSEPWVKDVLSNKGTSLTTNEAALKTFSDQLAFARMVDSGRIVEIANQTVRDGYEQKKNKLVRKIQRLTYESM